MTTHAQRIMAKLPPPGEPATVESLAAATRLERTAVAVALGRLLSAGMVDRPRRGVYRLTRAGLAARAQGALPKPGPRGPHTGIRKGQDDTLRAKVWRALRVVRKGTVRELLTLAKAGAERDAAGNARRYLRELESAGYVTRVRSRKGAAVPWVLLPERDTGPAEPRTIRSRGLVLDGNTGAEYPIGAGHG